MAPTCTAVIFSAVKGTCGIHCTSESPPACPSWTCTVQNLIHHSEAIISINSNAQTNLNNLKSFQDKSKWKGNLSTIQENKLKQVYDLGWQAKQGVRKNLWELIIERHPVELCVCD